MVRRIKRQEASTRERIGGTREKDERNDQEPKPKSNEDGHTMKSSRHTVSARVRSKRVLVADGTNGEKNERYQKKAHNTQLAGLCAAEKSIEGWSEGG